MRETRSRNSEESREEAEVMDIGSFSFYVDGRETPRRPTLQSEANSWLTPWSPFDVRRENSRTFPIADLYNERFSSPTLVQTPSFC